jgi:hypothetical protein
VLTFDIQTRGLSSILEPWKKDHDELKQVVWRLEDVINQACIPLLRNAIELDERYRSGAAEGLPTYDRLVDSCKSLIGACATALAAATAARVASRCCLEGVEELRRLLPIVQAIVDEDEFAFKMAVANGVLDE